MRPKAILFFCCLSFCSFAQKKLDSVLYINYYKSIIKTLADDSMKGREVSSIYEDKAAQFILKEFKKSAKLKPVVQVFNYTHPDSLKEKKSKNIYCFINNHADSTILIGAHYDHIGLGGKLSCFNQPY